MFEKVKEEGWKGKIRSIFIQRTSKTCMSDDDPELKIQIPTWVEEWLKKESISTATPINKDSLLPKESASLVK